MKAGHNVWYNDSHGTNRDADRVGQALTDVGEDGRLDVQVASGGKARFEAITGNLKQYDKEHDGNRGDCAWPVQPSTIQVPANID